MTRTKDTNLILLEAMIVLIFKNRVLINISNSQTININHCVLLKD